MKSQTGLRALLLTCTLTCSVGVHAQRNDFSPISVGGFLCLGAQGHDYHAQPSSIGTATLGIYGEWTRSRIHPGLEVRFPRDSNIKGTLVGPRVSMTFRSFHPYATALFGPATADSSVLVPTGGITSNRPSHGIDGISKGFAIGLDGDFSDFPIRWRVVEFSKSYFSGIPGSAPWQVTTGIVLYIP